MVVPGKSYFHPQTPMTAEKPSFFFVCHTITLILYGTLFTGSMLKDKMLFEQMQNRLIY